MQLSNLLAISAAIFCLFLDVALSSAVHTEPSVRQIDRTSRSTNATSVPLLDAPRIICNGDVYRRDLRRSSCVNAYYGISNDQQWVLFGTRGGRVQWHIDLPYRWISEDGLCVFDIYTANESIVDEARMEDFRLAASNLIHNCIPTTAGSPQGGIALGLGRHGNLGLIMTSFKPSIRCMNPPGRGRAPEDCYEIVNKMLAGKEYLSFGRAGTPGVQIALPLQMANEDRTCTATIDITRSSALESWYNIWEKMVAVDRMCTSQDLEGTAFGLGANGGIFLEMRRGSPASTALY